MENKTLKALENAIESGIETENITFFATKKAFTFDYFFCCEDGTLIANGKHSIDDIVPAGLFLWETENFIKVPDTIFTIKNEIESYKVAFYEL